MITATFGYLLNAIRKNYGLQKAFLSLLRTKISIIKTWEGIRDIIKITKKSKNNINSIQVNGRDITDPAIIANEFSNHFTTIAEQIEAKLITPNFHLQIIFQNLLKKL